MWSCAAGLGVGSCAWSPSTTRDVLGGVPTIPTINTMLDRQCLVVYLAPSTLRRLLGSNCRQKNLVRRTAAEGDLTPGGPRGILSTVARYGRGGAFIA